jgi:hypothetical protein
MLHRLQLEHIRIFKNIEENIDINAVLNYLEYYTNIYWLSIIAIRKELDFETTNEFFMFETDISNLIDNLNHQAIYIKQEEKVLIVPKNCAGIAAAEVSSEQTGLAILEYHHRLLKGDLSKKRNILHQIANEYEDVLKKTIEPKEIFSNTRELLNKLYIRHGNKENQKNISEFKDDELEKWYDELYQMLLLCILLNSYCEEVKPEIEKLLKSLKKRNY